MLVYDTLITCVSQILPRYGARKVKCVTGNTVSIYTSGSVREMGKAYRILFAQTCRKRRLRRRKSRRKVSNKL